MAAMRGALPFSAAAAALCGGVSLATTNRRSLNTQGCSMSARVKSLPLASSVRSQQLPTVVLVHGLDSSRETFNGTLSKLHSLGCPALALDLRGHGESPFGDKDAFSAESLAADVLSAIRAHGIDRCVLLGHSMGGRIVMRAAALEMSSQNPKVLASIIIEDMDLRMSDLPPKLEAGQLGSLSQFEASDGRRFASWEAAHAALLPWYANDSDRVNGWRDKRIRRQMDGTWWSDINPAAQRLAWERVLASLDGSEAWDELSSRESLPFSVHVWYADGPGTPRGTVCRVTGPGGIEDMKSRLPRAKIRFFPDSGHSIHNTQPDDFMNALLDVVGEARLQAKL